MTSSSAFWNRQVFRGVAAGCVLFMVLTSVAMLFYAGGTGSDRTTIGYSFSSNFFSDLGLTVSRAGKPNTISMVLFIAAMTAAGTGLAAFFVAFTQFFARSGLAKVLSWLAALVGLASGACFVGLGWTPGDVNLTLHSSLTRMAFYLFPVATTLASACILLDPDYPKRYAFVFGVFSLLLIAYIALLVGGPRASTPQGRVIQAVGQKIIVYASIMSILIEALGAAAQAQHRFTATRGR